MTSTSRAKDVAPDPTGTDRSGLIDTGRGLPTRLDSALLLAAPLLGSVVAGAAPMAIGLQSRWTMIDPSLYTAYIAHPSDLMSRFGGNDYFWVRLAFLLPAQALAALLGPVPGFVTWRYLLALIAIVPGFLLLRRRVSRPVAWCFVAATVTSPVVVMAWNSDYPDSAALSYLMAGAALAVFPVASARSRRGLGFGAGVALGLAVHAHAAAVPLVAAVGLAVLLVPAPGRLRSDVGLLAAGVLAVTALLSAVALLRWGIADIFSPTIDQYRRLQRPDQVALWHSRGWAWADRATYLLVPAAVLAALGVASAVRPGRLGGEGRTLAVAAAVGLVAAVVVQATGGFTLEYYFYSSLLWWFVPFAVALLAGVVLRDRPAWVWPVVATVVGLSTVAALTSGPPARFTIVPVGLVLAAVAVAAAAVAAWRADRATAVVGVVALIVACWALTIGQPIRSYAPGQVSFPLVDYSALARSDTAQARDVYRVVSRLSAVVPPARGDGEKVITWAPAAQPGTLGPPLDVVRQAGAQYLASRLSSAMPALRPTDVTQLDRTSPGTLLVMLGLDPWEFDAALRALAPWRPVRVADEVLASGSVTLHVRVVRLL